MSGDVYLPRVPMTIVRVLEIAKGSPVVGLEARALADEILRLREALHECGYHADIIRTTVNRARPEDTIGSWKR